MRRDYILFLKDINAAISSIFTFVEGMSYEEFNNDDKTVSAVIRKIEIMGEAVKCIPQKLILKYPDIPWIEMARTRDKFIHGYFSLNNEIIWKLIKERLPEIPALINKIIIKEQIGK